MRCRKRRRPPSWRRRGAPSARRSQPTCRGASPATIPTRPPVPAAARGSAWARTWPRSWTTCLACSRWSATSGASGPARSARRSPKCPSILTSSTRASPPPGCWRRFWWPSTQTTCRCTARKRSLVEPASPSRAPHSLSGWAPVACSCGRWWRRWRQSCCNTACCMLTRRRCPCSNRATARPTGPTYGPMPRAPSRTPRWPSDLKAELLQHRVLHADETPVSMLKPGNGTTHRAYLWAYATGALENTKVVVYDFCESRSGEHARRFLGDWRCSLTCDDFSGYKALIASGVTEVGCLAHARRKFFDLHAANQSQIAEFALQQFGRIYEIEHEVKELATDQRQAIRQQQTKPLLDALHQWMVLQRQKVPEGSASAKALDYSLRRWVALTRFVDDGQLPVDNNWIENQIRPIAIGRNNWLFAGSLRAGQRAAAVMSLIQSASINGNDQYAYLRDVMARLPMQRASQIGELLPHRWQPA